MATLQILEHFLQGKYASRSCGTETEYYALWHDLGIDTLTPINCAITGALLADRLSWVFTAGYQATLRNAFPFLPPGGWAAFAATEDLDDGQPYTGTTLSDDGYRYILNGHKSWVAHSRLVDHLIVTVNDPQGDKRRVRGLIIERGRNGVTLTHRERPAFLGAMSQGFAKFENTPGDRMEVFEFEPIRQFGRTEAKFVMLACTAFLLTRAGSSSELQDRLLAIGAALLSFLDESETSRQVYGSIDREFQRCVDRFEQQVDTGAIVDYESDRRLFRMYTDRIQRRVDYAKSEVGDATA